MNYATYAVSFLPFAKVPHYEVYGTNDGGVTRTFVMDDRTGKPAEFLDLKEAKKVMRGLHRAQMLTGPVYEGEPSASWLAKPHNAC